MFAPDSVAGYPADYQEPNFDQHWFSSVTIIARYKYIESFLTGKNLIAGLEKFTSIVDSVAYIESTISDPYDALLKKSLKIYTQKRLIKIELIILKKYPQVH